MTEASNSARVIPHPTVDRRLMESESLRNAMAASARRRAMTAHLGSPVKAYAVPKHQLVLPSTQPSVDSASVFGRSGLPRTIALSALAIACAACAGALIWWHQSTSVAAADTSPRQAQGTILSLAEHMHLSTTTQPAPSFMALNASGLTPQSIESKLHVHAAEATDGSLSDSAPSAVATPQPSGTRTTPRMPAAASRPLAHARTPVPKPAPGQQDAAAVTTTGPLGLPPGLPEAPAVNAAGAKPAAIDRAAAPAATQDSSTPNTPSKTSAAAGRDASTPSNQLIQFKAARADGAQSPSPAAAKTGPVPARARVLSVPVDGMVTVEVDGAVRTYRVGQVLPNGQSVVSADATSGKFVLVPPGGPGD